MASHRAPKQWSLTKSETVNSFKNWRQNLQYVLSLDSNFAPFLVSGMVWEKKSRTSTTRGLTSDGTSVPEPQRRTAQQMVTYLELMLGRIANYCPIISRKTITHNSVSIDSIWQTIRAHFGFQSTGAHFLDLSEFKLEQDECPEDLFQPITAFFEDNLLATTGGLRHHGLPPLEDEDVTPSLENVNGFLWLQLTHKDLPRLVKQRDGTELRSQTLASIKPEISQALKLLLDELRSAEDIRVMLSTNFAPRQPSTPWSRLRDPTPQRSLRRSSPSCILCKEAGRSFNHFLSKCTYLPLAAKRFLTRARLIAAIDDDMNDFELESPNPDDTEDHKPDIPTSRRVQPSSVQNIDVDILAGVLFMTHNDITIRPAKHQVNLADNTTYHYGSETQVPGPHAVRYTTAAILRSPASTTRIWPGDYLEVNSPPDLGPSHNHILALEPRLDATSSFWPPPSLITAVAGKIRVPNDTSQPLVIKKNSHVAQVCTVYSPDTSTTTAPDVISIGPTLNVATAATPHSSAIHLDPDKILPPTARASFQELHHDFDTVFDPHFTGYNGAAGPIEAVVNMGPTLPPQHKGRLPQYARHKLVELQEKFDTLEQAGVFIRPEDHHIVAEYLNPSFLIKKPSGGHRLVTAFSEVGRYAKPQPSLMPNVHSTLRHIARWKYIIQSDLTSGFYQIPLAKESMKYCGIVTPFKGVRVYARSAMGMPGSETAPEELMCRVLGDLVTKGIIVKLVDDLFCGGDSSEELLCNWRAVLTALHQSNLRLSAHKTTVAPCSTTILGWIWEDGTLQASSHRTAALSRCEPPPIVKGLRSFLGAYKILAHVMKNCSHLLSPLEDAVGGKASGDKITWTDALLNAFTSAKAALSKASVIHLPRPNDCLWIVTDGAVKNHGLGATLYITRDDSKLRLAGFFSAKLRKRQNTWLPCEIEALCIAASAHLKQGTRPSKKVTNAKDVKRYLNVATLAPDGLLIVRKSEPFAPAREQIIIPRSIICGLLTALHLKLGHPTQHQLNMVFNCHFLLSISTTPLKSPGLLAIIVPALPRRSRQFILVLLETVTSYTIATIIDNELHDTLREALLRLLLSIISIDGPPITVRTDAASGFQALVNDNTLKQHHITLDIGGSKNKNENPVAERAVQEFQGEILRQDPTAITTGNIVYLNADLHKTHARDRYLVTAVEDQWCHLRKFTGNQLRNALCKAKPLKCLLVPTDTNIRLLPEQQCLVDDVDSGDDDNFSCSPEETRPSTCQGPPSPTMSIPPLPCPPVVPPEIAAPLPTDDQDTSLVAPPVTLPTSPAMTVPVPARPRRTRKLPERFRGYDLSGEPS
eukprot:gene1407-1555_t